VKDFYEKEINKQEASLNEIHRKMEVAEVEIGNLAGNTDDIESKDLPEETLDIIKEEIQRVYMETIPTAANGKDKDTIQILTEMELRLNYIL
jgi:hypothetical protein